MNKPPPVAIVMGSRIDWSTMQAAAEVLPLSSARWILERYAAGIARVPRQAPSA